MENIELLSNKLERALLTLDRDKAEEIIRETGKENTAIIISGELVSYTLQRIGEAWEEGKLALSQVYMSGIICEELIDHILPPASPLRKDQPKTAIGVFEDYHMLGKRIIYSTLRASGIELMDLGGGLSVNTLVEIVKRENIKILLLSVLMLPSALHIKLLVEELSGIDVKIIVGGAPFRFDDQLWKEVGADATGKDTTEAIALISELIGVKA